MSKIDLYEGDCLDNKTISLMLHALGIEYRKYTKVEPNKRYSPYPTSYRNYYQDSYNDGWNTLVEKGFAAFRKGRESWQDCYFVTEKGKKYLKKIGYRWHER